MSIKKNILFVAFEFPPLNGAGVQRSLKFVKYLPQYDINPIVITIREEDGPKVMKGHSLDYSLLKDLPADCIIKRVPCPELTSPRSKFGRWTKIYFSITEEFKETWKPGLLEALPGIISQYKPQAIYVSLPPFAMAPLWLSLLQKYPIPLIVDFRDAWSQWCMAPNGSYFHYYFKWLQEGRTMGFAKKVICTSKDSLLDLQRVHPSISKEKFSVITNGYDGKLDWDTISAIPADQKIRIGYVGSFYYDPKSRGQIFTPWWKKPLHRILNYVPRKEDWLYRSPYFFFKAIRQLLDEEPGLASLIEIHFAGHTPDWLKEQIRSFELDAMCFHHGYLDHDAVIEFQQSCQALLITSAKVINGRDYSIAGKTFEYFTIGKPILAFVCEGAQRDILAETGMSLICDPDDAVGSADKIRQLLNGKCNIHPNKKNIEIYHRSILTGQLAEVIHSVTKVQHVELK